MSPVNVESSDYVRNVLGKEQFAGGGRETARMISLARLPSTPGGHERANRLIPKAVITGRRAGSFAPMHIIQEHDRSARNLSFNIAARVRASATRHPGHKFRRFLKLVFGAQT
jgi:hypothetical protein